jgi:carboxyl-terminal processing protease
MPLSRREKTLTVVCIFLATSLIISVVGAFRGNPLAYAKQSSDKDIYGQLKIFTDVLAIVQKDYVKDVDGANLIEGAIKGMITNLDPHSSYLDPEYYEDLQVQTKGEFGGLGIEITVKDGILTVVAPMEGGPAEKAGVMPGDAIVKIEGKFTKDYSMIDAVRNLRGPKGTPVTITLYRKSSSSTFDVKLVRDIIQVKSVKSRVIDDGFGYVKISQFVESTGDDLFMALRRIEKESPSKTINGLILDLRNNPGGLLNQAIRVADTFLKEGVIVYTDGRVESQKQKFFAQSRGTEENYPIVVLVNNGSASASEIVSGALKEDGRAVLVGTRTFGKGSVQTVSRLDNGGGLSLTTALYYLKNGESIQLKGVTPDIEIENPVIAPKKAQTPNSNDKQVQDSVREESLPGAILNPNGDSYESDSVPNNQERNVDPADRDGSSAGNDAENLRIDYEKEPIESWLKKDPQMAKAMEVLKGY